MKLRELYRAEDAASPVVGVILIIGVVVILAAGIGGTLVSTLDTSEPAPSANYDDEQREQHLHATGGHEGDFPVVTIRHDSGDQLNKSRLAVTVNGNGAWSVYEQDSGCSTNPCHMTEDVFQGGGAFSTGDSVTIAVKDHPELDKDEGFSMDADTGSDTIIPNAVDTSEIDDEENHVQLEAGDSVRLIWLSADRESSQTLYETEVSAGV